MDNSEKKSKADKPKASDTASRSSKPTNVRRQFEDAYYNYMQAIREATLDAHQRTEEAHQNYLQAQQDLQAEAQKQSWDAHLAYARALQSAAVTTKTIPASERPAEATEARPLPAGMASAGPREPSERVATVPGVNRVTRARAAWEERTPGRRARRKPRSARTSSRERRWR